MQLSMLKFLLLLFAAYARATERFYPDAGRAYPDAGRAYPSRRIGTCIGAIQRFGAVPSSAVSMT